MYPHNLFVDMPPLAPRPPRRSADVARKEAVARRNQAERATEQVEGDIERFAALRLADHDRMDKASEVN